MRPHRNQAGCRIARKLRASAVLTLIGLALMVWSLLDPTPVPVILAMTLGQLIGTFAFVLYGVAVFQDLRTSQRSTEVSTDR